MHLLPSQNNIRKSHNEKSWTLEKQGYNAIVLWKALAGFDPLNPPKAEEMPARKGR
jgi:hypothetical protein